MRKIAGLMLWLGLCCVLLMGCASAPAKLGENVVRNGGFELGEGAVPEGWNSGMWLTGQGISAVERTGEGHQGEASAFVENMEYNDARWEQTLTVQPKTLYRFSAWVRAEGCDPAQKGANLSIKDIYGTSPDLHDTKGEWVYIELFGRTGEGQKQVTLMARVGGYGSENIGKAWFDDIEACAVSDQDLPAGAVLLGNLKPQEAAVKKEDEPRAAGKPGLETFFMLAGIAALFAVIFLALGLGREREPQPVLEKRTPWSTPLIVTLGCGLLVRLLIAYLSPGYETDVNCFTAWSGRMVSNGPGLFYGEQYFCDYPPGYMYVLWLNGALLRLFGVSGNVFAARLILRAMPIACDLLGAYLLYRFARKSLGERTSIVLTAIYAFNPAAIVTGAAWGQVDSVLALGLFATVWLVEQRRWKWALPLYVLCVLVKPQALMAGPLGLLALIAQWVADKENRKATLRDAGIGLAISLAVAAVIVLPFWGKQEADWLLVKYAGTLGSYDYATLNTANLLYLLGGNWEKVAELAFAGISWNALGISGMVLVFALVTFLYVRAKRADILWACSALLFAGLFMLGIRMHERYLLPAILLLGGAYVRKRDDRYLIALIGFSATMLINTGMVLVFEHLIAPYVWVGKSLAVINLWLLALLGWTGWEDAAGRAPRAFRAPTKRVCAPEDAFNAPADALRNPRDHRLHMSIRDWGIMLAITLAYLPLAYANLGNTQSPTSVWKPGSPEEQVIFDLGEVRDFTMCYFGFGETMNDAFTVAFSNDGEEWTEENAGRMDGGICFRWVDYEYPMLGEDGVQLYDSDGDARWLSDSGQTTARYVRLTADGRNLELFEVAFRNPEGGIWPVTAKSGAGVTQYSVALTLLTDEQDTVPDKHSFMSGTYFDEIYHARTGYEFANDIHTFEWTHPPLGKLLIMLCIQLFGMTPFGWRFAGATVGVLMLPTLYLLAKQIWKRTDLATFATLLMALDCMHLTQTRIATIDSYPVLFIMLMYLFMFRYMQMSFYHQKLSKTLIPLALSGLATGLAIASKWIGLYAAIGLALLLFYTLYRRFAEWRYAQRMREEDPEGDEQTLYFWRNTAITLGWCVLWFLVVPALIYYFSYAVQFHADGGLTWKRFWDLQNSMYRYHSQLKATHPYESKWWQWPIVAKPMWYYSTDRLAGNRVSTILAFGNPAVWWGGLIALIAVFCGVMARCVRGLRVRSFGLRVEESEGSRGMLFTAALLLIGFASQYVPWVLVPRSTYIYHYFASVPFIILCMAQCAEWGFKDSKRLGYIACGAYLLLALALFIAFFPFASGAPMSETWAKAMQWAFPLPY